MSGIITYDPSRLPAPALPHLLLLGLLADFIVADPIS